MSRRRPRATLLIALLAGGVVVALVAVAAVFVAPQLIRAGAMKVADADTTVALVAPGIRAELPVRDGWAYVVGPFDDHTATLRSPDGAMTVDVDLTATDDAEQAVRSVAGAAVTPFDREPVGGSTVVHAQIVGEDAIVGAVVSGRAALVFTSRPATGYDAQLAELLAGIEVTP